MNISSQPRSNGVTLRKTKRTTDVRWILAGHARNVKWRQTGYGIRRHTCAGAYGYCLRLQDAIAKNQPFPLIQWLMQPQLIRCVVDLELAFIEASRRDV